MMDLDQLYAGVRARIGAALAVAGGAADEVRVPACPGWTVTQLAAHLAGTVDALVRGDRPDGDVQAWVDAQVAARAGRTALRSWREWNTVGPAFERLLLADPRGLGSLLYDAVIHEDDLNAALDRPAARDRDAVAYGLERLFGTLDRSARRAGVGSLEVVVGDPGPWLAVLPHDLPLIDLLER